MDVLPDPILVVDGEGRYIDMIGGADRLLYHDGSVLIGKRMHDVMPTAMADRLLALIRRTIESGSLQIEEYELSAEDLSVEDTDGQTARQWFQGRLAPVTLPGHDEPCVVWLAINITERVETRQELERRAYIDPLTGTLNRRAFVDELGKAEERFKRYGHNVSVGMFDIDFFKRVNDTYGHAVGDEVLIAVTQKMGETIRNLDSLGRWGGEEFCIVFPDIDEEKAVEAAERIREAIEAVSLNADGETFAVTISAGVSAMRKDDETPFDAVNRADEALYAAKEGGRNRVCRARDLKK